MRASGKTNNLFESVDSVEAAREMAVFSHVIVDSGNKKDGARSWVVYRITELCPPVDVDVDMLDCKGILVVPKSTPSSDKLQVCQFFLSAQHVPRAHLHTYTHPPTCSSSTGI